MRAVKCTKERKKNISFPKGHVITFGSLFELNTPLGLSLLQRDRKEDNERRLKQGERLSRRTTIVSTVDI